MISLSSTVTKCICETPKLIFILSFLLKDELYSMDPISDLKSTGSALLTTIAGW